MYYAIIGDIIKSRELENREEIQKSIFDLLKKINEEYKEQLASKFTITLGDEFQGLLVSPQDIFLIIDIIRYSIPDVNFRFGIGVGDIYTDINPEYSIGADGPAYWNARRAIQHVYSNNDYKRNYLRICSTKENAIYNTINYSIISCSYIENSWSKMQKQFVVNYILKNGYRQIPQVKIAVQNNLDKQSTNRHMKKTGLENYIKLRQSIQILLGEIEKYE